MGSALSAEGRGGEILGRGARGNALVLSVRRLADLVAFCQQYEFEDVIADVTRADRVYAEGRELLEFSRRAYRAGRLVTASRRMARALAPNPRMVRLDRDYDLFFLVLNNPYELFALATLPEWRTRCRVGVCFFAELWAAQRVPGYLLEILSDFDHVFMGTGHVVADVRKSIGRPCHYLPLAADVLRFSPYPNPPVRAFDVCNIGRRSHVTHQAFLQLARERRLAYYYDTVAASGPDQKQRTFRVSDPIEHRLLLASVLQRSRYFLANRSRVNEPDFTLGSDEISGRFYEGAAAGTVMLGEAPRTKEFAAQFDWPDAVIELPFDSPEAGRLIGRLDQEPERLTQIRRANAYNAARRHDWVHRLRTIFEVAGLAPTAEMHAREQRLRELADSVLEGPAG